jgi:sterol desaturase/sphingolipid hydroxylase (fatty acid hydroxylase superfamily)
MELLEALLESMGATCVYWLAGFLSTLIYPTDQQVPHWPTYVLFNQLVVTTTFLSFVEPQQDYVYGWQTVPEITSSLIYLTFLFYVIHLGFHRWFYRYHKRHHRWIQTHPLAAWDAHPLEHLCINLIPTFYGPIVHGWNATMLRVWCYLAVVNSVWAHTETSQLHFHNVHHRKQNVNFGSTPVWDHLFGTAQV